MGVRIAPVVGSGDCPPWIASVAIACASMDAMARFLGWGSDQWTAKTQTAAGEPRAAAAVTGLASALAQAPRDAGPPPGVGMGIGIRGDLGTRGSWPRLIATGQEYPG